MKEQIRKALNQVEHYERLADQKIEAYEADPTNTDREEAFDKAYELEFNALVHAAHLISQFAGIDFLVAKEMVHMQRAKLIEMFS